MKSLKGNAIVGQSGGPTVVINESLVGVIREARRHSEITGIFGALHGIEGILKQEIFDLGAESAENLKLVARTPSAALGSVRKKPSEEDCEAIFRVLEAHSIHYFFYIGGNDSAETASILNGLSEKHGYELRVCHIPKTIDNDLLVTDHCPGFGSAARFVALALQGDNLDNRALRGVKIDVIMGRSAGFLTAAAGLGRREKDDGPHHIYVPEVPFQVERFCADVEACMKKWNRCVVAVSEGIQDENKKPILTTSGEKDSHGNTQLSGTGALGDHLANVVKEKLGVKRVRSDTFGYLQRSFPTIVSEVDAREAREVGAFGVRELTTGGARSGSVSIRRRTHTAGEKGERPSNGWYTAEYFLTDLASVARNTRSLDAKFLAPGGSDTTAAFERYALPLVGELPVMGRLSGRRIRPRKI
ncbi:MAG TPA: 6-phosphofructokinase [Planctomycetota bacterium]|nr:6-phosphofructokinase [Planctomycetota bacterium]